MVREETNRRPRTGLDFDRDQRKSNAMMNLLLALLLSLGLSTAHAAGAA